MNILKKYLLILLLLNFYGCSLNNKDTENQQEINIPEEEYVDAKLLLDNENFEKSLVAFERISKKYPLSHWAIKSKIMIVFIYYLQLDYENASIHVDRFIIRYPDYKDIDYIYYLRALIAYEQIQNPGLDVTYTNHSIRYFEELIRRFPDSKYSKDGKQKIILIKTILAGKDMHVGMYYLNQKKYIAALNRFKKVIDEYVPNRYTPEALYRIVEIYYILGIEDESKRVAAVLGYNYPESEWYNKSYKILGNIDIDKENNDSWAGKLFNKIF